MHTDRNESLVVLTAVSAERTARGGYRLTHKFLEGMAAYTRAWDGPVHAMFDPRSVDTGNLDLEEVSPHDVGFSIELVRFGSPEFYASLTGRGVVLAGPTHLLPDLAERCRALGVPCVYNTEYTLKTRLQFLRAERSNPLARAWGSLWEVRQEAQLVKQLRLASGVQCNGIPCFLKYGPLNAAPLLYFDSRIHPADLATEDELIASNCRRRRGEPLHLVFSGRLIRAKGADHLLTVAEALRARSVPFRMTICGGGVLTPAIEQRIQKAGLCAQVRLSGVLDFERELLPMLKRSADLFVCCHRQGDPSCTYLETFACGVPIVGYANEALATFVAETDAGATVPNGNAEALADLIAKLDDERDRLCIWAYRARDFAARHTMDHTFAARIRHLEQVKNAGLGTSTPSLEPVPISTTLQRTPSPRPLEL